jgi:hypothetical protein
MASRAEQLISTFFTANFYQLIGSIKALNLVSHLREAVRRARCFSLPNPNIHEGRLSDVGNEIIFVQNLSVYKRRNGVIKTWSRCSQHIIARFCACFPESRRRWRKKINQNSLSFQNIFYASIYPGFICVRSQTPTCSAEYRVSINKTCYTSNKNSQSPGPAGTSGHDAR